MIGPTRKPKSTLAKPGMLYGNRALRMPHSDRKQQLDMRRGQLRQPFQPIAGEPL